MYGIQKKIYPGKRKYRCSLVNLDGLYYMANTLGFQQAHQQFLK